MRTTITVEHEGLTELSYVLRELSEDVGWSKHVPSRRIKLTGAEHHYLTHREVPARAIVRIEEPRQ
jgi:hypothetical protein